MLEAHNAKNGAPLEALSGIAYYSADTYEPGQLTVIFEMFPGPAVGNPRS